MMLNQKNLEILQKGYDSCTDSFIYVVYGNSGLGKTYTINRFLSDRKNVIHIDFTEKSAFALEPFVCALSSFSDYPTDSLMISGSSLKLKETLLKELLSLCSNRRLILYFENIVNCEQNQLEFLIGFLKQAERCDIFTPFVILELDTNNPSSAAVFDCLDSLPFDSTYIKFEQLSEDASKKYIDYLFKTPIDISEKSLNYIVKAGGGNMVYLNIIVNYLKRKEYIKHDGLCYNCDEIPSGELLKALANNIINRYETLSQELQTILQKAGIVGVKFNSNMIGEVFDVLSADERFDDIEEGTSLVHSENRSEYYFENSDVHKLILRQINPEDQHKWEQAVIDYYKKKLSTYTGIDKLLAYSYKLSTYLQALAQSMHKPEYYSEYEFYMIKCIVICINISDFSQALNYIREIKESLCNHEADRNFLFLLMFYEAKCKEAIGEYASAIKLYEKCLEKDESFFSRYEYLETKLDLAYCYYMNGYLPSALEITLSVQSELNDEESLLNCKILSLLSSVYHLQGNDKDAEEYYTRSLSYLKKMNLEKEYYIQLKKSSMIMDIEVAKPLLAESLHYFEKNGIIRELAETLHTYYTNDLYLLVFDHFETGIKRSIALFINYGSIMVHYPLNTYGIYVALIKNDLLAAMEQFEKALQYDIESFSQITLLTNMAACKMLWGELTEAKHYIEKADKLIFQEENREIVLLNTYHFINWSLYYKAIGHYNESALMLKNCLTKLDVQDRHKYWLQCQFQKVNQLMNDNILSLPNDMPETYPFIKLLVKKDTFFATMRFYE